MKNQMTSTGDLEMLRNEGLGYRSEEAVIRIISTLLKSVEELQQAVWFLEKENHSMKRDIDSLRTEVVINDPRRWIQNQ